ncbi:MAG: tRNA threonylcarbamoyladenosine biosynthesis protein TsaE [Solirubrobacteraceae bacterium]|jgi:tRNA threonylcarbamoyladenosine biosynthesis protein TsaE|nr:tRNA threonylcarbamoyladenosine biosynthesis protein TsaE [Solirubrobacteraceae bacterium]
MPSPAEQTASAAETEALGAALARELRPGDVVLLSGDLGAGKTTFVRGALRALGVTGPVTSPTFTLARRYTGDGVEISHLDLHRLAGAPDEEDEALLSDEATDARITFVEWPEMGGELPFTRAPRAHVRLAHAGGDRRTIAVT